MKHVPPARINKNKRAVGRQLLLTDNRRKHPDSLKSSGQQIGRIGGNARAVGYAESTYMTRSARPRSMS